MSSLEFRAWEWALVHKLLRSPYLEVVAVVLVTPPGASVQGSDALHSGSKQPGNGVFEYANRIVENKTRVYPDATALRDGVELISRIPTTRVRLIGDRSSHRWNADDLERMKRYGLDVFITFISTVWTSGLSAAARYGVWSLRHGDERMGFGSPAGFWEVHFGWPVVASMIEVDDGRSARPAVVHRSYSATDMTSVRRSNNEAYWKVASLLPSKLEELCRAGPDSFFSRAAADLANCRGPASRSSSAPTRRDLARQVLRICRRGVRARFNQRFLLPQWILLYRHGETLSTSVQDFQKIIPPKECYWADPHVVFRDGKHYVFFEEVPFSTNKGHISVFELDEAGRHSPPLKVLECPYHVSYPHLIEHDGELYMVPETFANGTIELYRCTRFPDQWELAETVMQGVYAADATLIHRDGRWWLFTNIAEHPDLSSWDHLYLFHSDSLLGGKWISHPLNPIVSDVRRARPAGPLFEKGGRLYRPSQDCSVRYGYGIRINEITTLEQDDYAEMESEAIWPTWDRNVIATHTLCHAGNLTVADALQPRFGF